MKKLFFCLISLVISVSLFAGKVSPEVAQQVAKAHYFQAFNRIKSLNWNSMDLNLKIDPTTSNDFKFYVFNVGKEEGYVIVSSDDAIIPILAYSDKGVFNDNNMAPAQREFYSYYNYCIEVVQKQQINNSKSMDIWQQLLNFDPKNQNEMKAVITSPLLLDGIEWDQSYPYNSACPKKNGNLSVTGCVATAMCQIMKYWNWPAQGAGIVNHPSSQNGGFGNISINFANQTYDWGAVPDKASNVVNEELGKINYHAGVAVRMHWDPDGSSSTTVNIVTALKNNFRYASSVTSKERNSYTDANWKNLIIAELDAKRPIVYSGHPTTGVGHAWNCDGYQIQSYGDYFHMNWGWGGNGDLYCHIDTLVSISSQTGIYDNFNVGNTIIIGIKPNSEFQYGCINNYVTRPDIEGSFSNGSYGNNYENNLNCTYLISACGGEITLKFSKFNLASGDRVKIYTNSLTEDNLVDTYDMNNIPSPSTSKAYFSSNVYINFTTDGNETAEGWRVNYSVKTCSATQVVLTDKTGSIDVYSADCLYKKSLNCVWNIAPEGNIKSIHFSFDNFSLANKISDKVEIYSKWPLVPTNSLYSFDYSNPPSGTYNYEGDTVFIRFRSSNDTPGASGWKISYTTTTTTDTTAGINSNDFNKFNLQIFPNPSSSNDITISLDSELNSNTTFSIVNVLGEVISYKSIKLQNGKNRLSLKDITSKNLNDGMYYLNIKTNSYTQNAKFLIVN
ncbi:MAG: C10 family peptidase [Bacteroidales bacterium]|jgi:hypothetical protein|nr:C10 family peptidase [Bacteroidales bacterium]